MNNTKSVNLFKEEDEDWKYPPFFTIYGLDGVLYVYQVYQAQYKDHSCLTKSNLIDVVQSNPKPF